MRPWRYISGQRTLGLSSLWHRQRGLCAYCRRATVKPPKNHAPRVEGTLYASRDHRQPTSRGGDNSVANLVMACEPCNQIKGHMLWTEWVEFMTDHPGWWASHEARQAAATAGGAFANEAMEIIGLAARNRIPNPVMTADQTAAWLARGGDCQIKEDQNGAHDVP